MGKSGEDNTKGDDKAEGKKHVEPRGMQKQNNPYSKPILDKCYHCNQPGHRSNECPSRRSVNIVHRDDEGEVCVNLMEGMIMRRMMMVR